MTPLQLNGESKWCMSGEEPYINIKTNKQKTEKPLTVLHTTQKNYSEMDHRLKCESQSNKVSRIE